MLPAALLALAGLTAASPNVILHFSPRICMPGLEWAYYALTNGTGQGQVPDNTMPGSYQDQFSTDAVKGVEPTTTGTSLRITYGSESEECDASPAVVDGVSQGNASHATYSVVQHRGYLVAEQTGNYTLSVSASDLVAAWFGQDAVSGWDWSNVAVMAQSDGDDEDGGSDGLQTYSFEATEVCGFRLFFGSCSCEDMDGRKLRFKH
ncbi:hypothetical protein MCOR25_003269 [Pyricularia grisea]|nr:hypothetical protein MCOR25_003269 [Pyricularia grisea]